MYYSPINGVAPAPFEPFNFFIEDAPDYAYDIFHIPSEIMFKAALKAGFGKIDFALQHEPNPEFKDNAAVRRYIDEI